MPDKETAMLLGCFLVRLVSIAKKELCNIWQIASAAGQQSPLHLLITLLQIITRCLRMLCIPSKNSGQHIRKVVLLSGASMQLFDCLFRLNTSRERHAATPKKPAG